MGIIGASWAMGMLQCCLPPTCTYLVKGTYMIVLMILCFFCCLYFYFFVSTGLEIHAIDSVKSLRVCIPWYSNDVFFLCVFDFFPLLINMENKIIF